MELATSFVGNAPPNDAKKSTQVSYRLYSLRKICIRFIVSNIKKFSSLRGLPSEILGELMDWLTADTRNPLDEHSIGLFLRDDLKYLNLSFCVKVRYLY